YFDNVCKKMDRLLASYANVKPNPEQYELVTEPTSKPTNDVLLQIVLSIFTLLFILISVLVYRKSVKNRKAE
ncbi:MAG: hypothetical protein ACRC5C_05515, partial [Bacilli bacterium]